METKKSRHAYEGAHLYGRVASVVRAHGLKRVTLFTLAFLKTQGPRAMWRYFKYRLFREENYAKWIVKNDFITDKTRKTIRADMDVFLHHPRWADILDNDPYYNPNLNVLYGDFTLADAVRI